MLKTVAFLFIEFFKTGLFTFGGGYASLPFLYQISNTYNWFSQEELTQMIAISGLTPGPIGLNMATFAGFKTLGITGALLASFALILPMIIITSIVFRLYKKFDKNNYVKSILYILRPTSCALILSVGINLIYNLVMKNSLDYTKFDYGAILTLVVLFLITLKSYRNPIIYMVIAGIFGVYFVNFS